MFLVWLMASQVAPGVKNPLANARDIRDVGLNPGSGRSPGGGHGYPRQCSCLGNPKNRKACKEWHTTEADMQSGISQISSDMQCGLQEQEEA